MKSNKSISRIIFLAKFHFLQFQKWQKINFWTGKKFKTAKNAISQKRFFDVFDFTSFFASTLLNFGLLCMGIWLKLYVNVYDFDIFTRLSNHMCQLLILLGNHGKCFITIPFSRSFILEPKTKCILSIFNHIAACILRIFSTCIFVGEESSKTNVYTFWFKKVKKNISQFLPE